MESHIEVLLEKDLNASSLDSALRLGGGEFSCLMLGSDLEGSVKSSSCALSLDRDKDVVVGGDLLVQNPKSS